MIALFACDKRSSVGYTKYMNIHPIFVHFPVAFLTIYALFELVRMKKLRENTHWLMIKAVLLWVGFLGTLAALQTGEMAEDLVGRNQLIEVHSQWGTITSWIFGVLSLVYALAVLERYFGEKIGQALGGGAAIFKRIAALAAVAQRSPLSLVIALAGLAAVSITGALGGAIAYGPDIDPVVKFVYGLFFPAAL